MASGPQVYKCTMIFEGRSHGWTETYWRQQDALGLEAVMREFEKLATKRNDLLGTPCGIKALRVSTEGETGDGLLRNPRLKAPEWDYSAAEQDVALLIRCQDAPSKKRKNVFLRGIPDVIEGDHGEYKAGFGGWPDHLKPFLAALESTSKGTWGWWGVTSKTTVPLTTYTVGADQRITFTASANVFPLGVVGQRDRVRLSGVNGKSNINGVQVVDVISQTQAVTYLPLASVPYVFGGRMTYNVYGFIPIVTAEDQRITTRKAGAPLLESHGRSKARKRV